MDYSDYYSECFQDDLRRFVESIPAESRHCHVDHTQFTIQIYTLWKDSPYLNSVRAANHANFAVALFFTILVDEVFYTYYQSHYAEFRALTQYPKLIGNCPGGCNYHNHPAEIFTAINFSPTGTSATNRADVKVSVVFRQAIPIMREEIFDFFENHLPSIDAADFWARCLSELPY